MSKTSSEGSETTTEELPPCPESVPNVDTEEDEIFAEKAILFRFSSERTEWLTRGCGLLKILKHKDTGIYRILMRQNQTYKVRANHQIPYLGTLRLSPGSNRQFLWTAFDYSDNEEARELFAVRFALPGIASSFQTSYESGQAANRSIIEK
jgi:hypothetical protein